MRTPSYPLHLLILGSSLIFTACFSGYAQVATDSLKERLKGMPAGPDKLKVYGQISWDYINDSQFENAARYADTIRYEARQAGDSSGVAYAEFYYGVIARFRGEHRAALEHLNRFVEFNTSAGDSIKVSHGLFQTGSIYARVGNYEKSLKALYRALRIQEAENNQSSINFTLNSIAVVLKEAKRYNESLRYFERVLLTDSLNTDVIMNIGNLYTEQNNLDRAEEQYLRALEIDRSLDAQREVAYDLESLGNLYNARKLPGEALSYHTRALVIRQHLPYRLEEGASLKQVGSTYLLLKKYNLAENYLLKALAISEETGTATLSGEIMQQLATLYSERGNYSEAYAYLETYARVNDSLVNAESTRQVNELQTKYETEKKEQQIALLAREKELQQTEIHRQATLKNMVIGGSFLIALIAALILYTYMQRMKNQKAIALKNDEIREVNFKRQLSELEMKALQAQINPHFIFNCLNAINQMILDEDKTNASVYLSKFSKLLRMILEHAESTEISLKDELTMLEAYIQLESLRFNGEINYNIHISESVDPDNTYLPSMVLQPFVENAIWHGLRHKKDAAKGIIRIGIIQRQDQLVCSIEDNGVGREKALELQHRSVWKSKSLGLKITEERLKLISKELQRQLIRIEDLKDRKGKATGTRVDVNIPIS